MGNVIGVHREKLLESDQKKQTEHELEEGDRRLSEIGNAGFFWNLNMFPFLPCCFS